MEPWGTPDKGKKSDSFQIEPLKEAVNNLPLRYGRNQERTIEGHRKILSSIE